MEASPDYDNSRIGLEIGDLFEGDGKTFVKIEVCLNKDKANEQIESLKNLGEIDVENAIVLSFTTGAKGDGLKNKLDEMFKGPIENVMEIEGMISSMADYKSCQPPGKVVMSLKPSGPFEEMINGPLQMAGALGLTALTDNQKNSLVVEASLNSDFEEIGARIKEGNGIGASFLETAKAEIKVSLHKDAKEGVLGILKNVDPDMANFPPLVLGLTYFESLNMDVRFSSLKELPEVFRKYLLTPKKFRMATDEDKKLQNKPALLDTLINSLEGELDIYVTLPDMLMVKISINAPKLGGYIENYGGLIEKLIK